MTLPPRDEAMDVDPPQLVEGLAEPHGNPVVTPGDPPAQVRVPGTPQGGAVPHTAPAAPLTAAHANPFSPPPLPLADLLQQHRNLTTQRLALQARHAALRTHLTQLTQVEEEKKKLWYAIQSPEGDVEKEEVEVEAMERVVRRGEGEREIERCLGEVREVRRVLGEGVDGV
ncbi:hypothetical protein DXG01_011152 [Tephrocybe rancida]|nr:hypothetical protein DXG01_011152 [Tephrocybe rancida]